jgi:hypothetical protein
MDLTELPVNVLNEIFSYISCKDRASCRIVSRKWNKLMTSGVLITPDTPQFVIELDQTASIFYFVFKPSVIFMGCRNEWEKVENMLNQIPFVYVKLCSSNCRKGYGLSNIGSDHKPLIISYGTISILKRKATKLKLCLDKHNGDELRFLFFLDELKYLNLGKVRGSVLSSSAVFPRWIETIQFTCHVQVTCRDVIEFLRNNNYYGIKLSTLRINIGPFCVRKRKGFINFHSCIDDLYDAIKSLNFEGIFHLFIRFKDFGHFKRLFKNSIRCFPDLRSFDIPIVSRNIDNVHIEITYQSLPKWKCSIC